jgi:hypothetical protein
MARSFSIRFLVPCLLAVAAGAALADEGPAADPVERYLKVALEQISRVEEARVDASGRPLDLTEFNDAYSDAMAAAGEQQQNDLFAHHHKVLECMSDRRRDGDEGLSIYQSRARCKSELSDLAYTVQEDGRRLSAQQQAAARSQAAAPQAAEAPPAAPQH